jgi:DNA repair protein RecO (recombination protein O)
MRNQRVYRTEAIVLRASDFGEADRLLTLFTAHHGKIRAIAKGARRLNSRLGGHIDLLMHVQLQIAHGRTFEIVTQAATIESFLHLRDDLWRASNGYELAEILDRLTEEGHDDRPLFDALLDALRRVDASPDAELAVQMFEATLLDRLGYRSQLHTCITCGSPLERVDCFYSAAGGGVLCPSCGVRDGGARPLSGNAFATLRLLQSADYATLQRVRRDEPLRREVEETLHSQIRYVLERDLKSTAFLTRLRAMNDAPAGLT